MTKLEKNCLLDILRSIAIDSGAATRDTMNKISTLEDFFLMDADISFHNVVTKEDTDD